MWTLKSWRKWAEHIRLEADAVFLASKDPRTPWYAKLLALFVVAYLLSPIDLIPDFIPILGYLDDLVLVPAWLALVVALIPTEIMNEHRAAARLRALDRKPNMVAAVVVATLWLIILGSVLVLTSRAIKRLI